MEVIDDLDGSEFITNIFHPDETALMILVLGENTEFEQKGPAILYLYACEDGEVEYGINTFVFFEREEMLSFLDELPMMSALDFIKHGTGCRPNLYFKVE